METEETVEVGEQDGWSVNSRSNSLPASKKTTEEAQ